AARGGARRRLPLARAACAPPDRDAQQLTVPQVERVEEAAVDGEAVELGVAQPRDDLVTAVLADAHDAAVAAALGRVHDAVGRRRGSDQPAAAERTREGARAAVARAAEGAPDVRRGEAGARALRHERGDAAGPPRPHDDQ